MSLPIVLVTGITAGSLGASIAIKLALTKKYKVVGTLRSLGKKEQDFNDDLEARGGARGTVKVIELDVTKPESCAAAIEKVGPRIDILINNAGAGMVHSTEAAAEEKVRQCFDVNFFGPYRMMKLVIPLMRKVGGGQIINVSSVGGLVGQPFNDAYCASKAALDSVGESTNSTLRSFNIYVSTFCPGAMSSNFVHNIPSFTSATTTTNDDFGEAYQGMKNAYFGRIEAAFNSEAFKAHLQSPDEAAADLIDNLLLANHDLQLATKTPPPVRYVTKQAQYLADLKFGDQTGEKVVQYMRRAVEPITAPAAAKEQ